MLLEGFSKLVCSKEQAKTLNLISSSTNEQKLSAHVQKVPIYCYNPSKKYSSRDKIPFTLIDTQSKISGCF
jgi:hypothetical protein